jgi:protein required for attachment to host cells
MPIPTTWIVVADGELARFHLYAGRETKLEPALPFEMRAPNPSTQEQGADRPGRVFDSGGQARQAIQPHADWHRETKRKFARDIAALLGEKAREKAFQRLILIAPPKTMGDLREALDDMTAACVKSEITKDLTHLSARELHDYLLSETTL